MAKSWKEVQCELRADKVGIIWDLLLYVPTVGFLLLIGLRYWYAGDEQILGEVLMFLGFFFFMVGGGRVLRRLLLMPSAPIALDVSTDKIVLKLKNGSKQLLMRDIRFFADKAGKSFGLTGTDERGRKQQYVFHKGQFLDEDYVAITKALAFYE